ncbi:MAG TPA: pyruvate dehydrogenase complex dihydrolipoamide acetyltransferase [Chitinophagaceae bacterium]|jgi:pyruvate dehydrogenase E2 component (dihydrolipoamide acetyltransferase)
MAEAILMPRLSDTMTEGVIAAWHKKVGDPVKKGDLLAEIETDKATMELESYQEGTLLHIGADNGEKLEVNDLLAIIGKQGEDVSSLIQQHKGGGDKAGATQTPPATEQKARETAPAKQAEPTNGQPATDKQKTASSEDYSSKEEVVLMPRLSDTMTEGVIAAWHKKVGDDVKKGEVLADIETDKATMELESYKEGKLLYQGAKEGEKVLVNDLLAIIGKEGLDVDAIVKGIKGSKTAGTGAEAPVAKTSEDKQKAEGDTAPGNAQVQQAARQGAQQAPQPMEQPQIVNEGRIFVSPLAKRLAEEKGIDLRYVKGTGDNGRITKVDIESFKPAAQPQPAPKPVQKEAAPTTPAAPAGQVSFEEIPVSQMRKTIAKRLVESKFSAPHFYVTMKIDMDEVVAARARINELSKVKISFNDIVLKAVAVALKQHPKVNSSWLGDKIRINHHVNIGVAVAVEEGLLVPVVRFADTKSLSQIATEVKDFAERARNKKLQPADWEGSTFTISNMGMFGVDEFTGIINPPDACLLAVGGISKVPVVKNDQVVPGNVMKVTLSCDHRVVDGATGAAFLQTLKGILEEPLRMLV